MGVQVSADIVCLQEVMGAHEVHPLHVKLARYLARVSRRHHVERFRPVAMPYTRKDITVTPFFHVIPL